MNERERATITGILNSVNERDGQNGQFVAMDVKSDTGSRLTIRAFTDRGSTFPDKKQSQALKLQEGDAVSLMVEVHLSKDGQKYHNLVQVNSTSGTAPAQPNPRQVKAQLPRGNGDPQRNSIERQTSAKEATVLTIASGVLTTEEWDKWWLHVKARIQDTPAPSDIASNGDSEEWRNAPIDESMMPNDEDVLGFV
jgi:hypothetical protein